MEQNGITSGVKLALSVVDFFLDDDRLDFLKSASDSVSHQLKFENQTADTNSTSCEAPSVDALNQSSTIRSIFYTVIIGVTTSLIFFTNILLIITILSSKYLRNPRGCLLVSVAVADLLIGTEAAFGFVAVLTKAKPVGETVCDVLGYATSVSVSVTMFTLAAISLDQWHEVHRPLKYHQLMTNTKAIILASLIWILSFVIYLPYFYSYVEFNFIPATFLCMIDVTLPCKRLVVLFMKIASTVPSVLIIITCSLLTCKTAHQHQRQIACFYESGRLFEHIRRPVYKHVRTTCLIVASFCITWMPLFIVQVYTTINQSHIVDWLLFGSQWILISNSYINFFICVATNMHFRKSLIKVLVQRPLWTRCQTLHVTSKCQINRFR